MFCFNGCFLKFLIFYYLRVCTLKQKFYSQETLWRNFKCDQIQYIIVPLWFILLLVLKGNFNIIGNNYVLMNIIKEVLINSCSHKLYFEKLALRSNPTSHGALYLPNLPELLSCVGVQDSLTYATGNVCKCSNSGPLFLELLVPK